MTLWGLEVPISAAGKALGVVAAISATVAFLASLLGVSLSGPGKLAPRVTELERRMDLVEALVVAECLDPDKRLQLVLARVPCAALLQKAGLE